MALNGGIWFHPILFTFNTDSIMINKPMSHLVPIPVQESIPTFIQDDDNGGRDLATYFRFIFDNRWLISTIALAVTLLGVAYAFLAKPVYEANMLIHVEEQGRANESKSILGEMASTFDVKTSAISEMELLRSRLVVSRAVDNLQLYIDVHPKYFPVIGAQFAEHNNQLSAPGLFGYGGYVWGAEKVDVSIFNVPDSFMNREFTITAERPGQFTLNENEQHGQWKGIVGKTLYAETEKGLIELRVDRLAANAGAQFLLRRTSRLSTIEDVQKAMTITEQGKQSGVISVTLKGKDPQLVSSTLGEISREYMRQNRARKTEEAEKSLNFLDKQLPELKQKLEQSEVKYNQFRNSHGTIDLGEEAKLSLQLSAAAKSKRLELQQKRTEFLTRFTSEHPIVVGINSQIREMNDEIRSLTDHIKQLPMLEQEVLSLNRDIKVNTDLYTGLLNTSQQLRLISAGKVSNVRLVDAPMLPERSVRPGAEIIPLAVLLGLLIGMICALIKKSINSTIDDPDQIEKIFGVQVYATIPHSKNLKKLNEQVGNKSPHVPLLANVSSADIAIESLRTFCTTLDFSMSQSRNNIILMTGATPGLGKTFVSANLAAIIAMTGKKVLLVDADLRNGHLHKYFGLARRDGLSDFLFGTMRSEQIIHRNVTEHMDFVSTGTLPLNPSELLLRPRFGKLLQSLSADYDLVLIDTTPILNISDTLIIGSHAGVIYIVVRAGVTTAYEVKESMKRLSQAGLAAKGVMFNDLKLRPGRYGYEYIYGQYRQIQYSENYEDEVSPS
jgi:tyrosine-protein kinase Etk/Wzc